MAALLRAFVSLLLLLASFIAAMVALALGGFGYIAMVGAVACLVAGFLSLRLARRPDAPAVPLYITVGVCCIIAVAMLGGLSWPPARSDGGTWLVLLVSMTMSLIAAGVSRRHRRTAIVLLALPAVNAAWSLVRISQVFRAAGGPNSLGPSVTIAFIVAAAMAAGWLVAPWHAWTAGVAGSSTGTGGRAASG